MLLIPISKHIPFFYQNINFLKKIKDDYYYYQDGTRSIYQTINSGGRSILADKISKMLFHDFDFRENYKSNYELKNNNDRILVTIFGLDKQSVLSVTSIINEDYCKTIDKFYFKPHHRFKNVCRKIINISQIDELDDDQQFKINIPSLKEEFSMNFNHRYFKIEHISGISMPDKEIFSILIERYEKKDIDKIWEIENSDWKILKLSDTVFQLISYSEKETNIYLINFEE